MQENDIDQYYRSYQYDQTLRQTVQPSSYLQLFKFSDKIDVILMLLGTGFALGGGVSLIFYARPFGQLVDAFANQDKDKIVADTKESVYGFLINSAIVFVISWLSTTVWMVTSQRQMTKARIAYFESLLRQQTAWHDRNKPAEICSKMYIQIAKVHNALVNNVTSVLTKLSLGFSGIAISLLRGWKMAVVMIGFLPLMMLAAYCATYYYKKSEKYLQKTKAKTDSQVIEVFQNVKTVKMLGGQQYESSRFVKKIKQIEQSNTNYGLKSKISFAIFFFSILMNYALGFWYGAKLVSQKTHNDNTGNIYLASDVVVIFFTLYLANLSLSGLPQSLASFNISRLSMKKMLLIISRQSRVKEGHIEMPQSIQQITFRNVMFRYQRPLFENFDLTIKKGVTALIGQSGNGKTTIINLIMRFYDIFRGQIGIFSEGKFYNIKNFTFQSLRSRIGYVGQEPVLIGRTIRQALTAQSMKDQQIKQILEKVKAWSFVEEIGLDSQFNSLSGGQKQRIAIARALIKKPTILILDQGTSALDRKTQQEVLRAIKKMKISFVIMIAHRMETVVNADRIIKLDKGKIVAEGDFTNLVRQGVLQQLKINKQQNEQEKLQQLDGTLEKLQKKSQVLKMIQEADKGKQQQLKNFGADKQFKWEYFPNLMKINVNQWYYYVLGIAGACYIGAIFPVFSYLLSHIIVTLSSIERVTPDKLPHYQSQVMYMSLGMFMISVSSLIILSLKGVSFTFITERQGYELKKKSFEVSLAKPMLQIDQIGRQHLAHIVNTNCQDLKLLTGHYLGDIFENLMTIIVGLGIALYFSWQITLVAIGIFPLILLSGKIQMSFNQGLTSTTDQVHKKTHELVIDSIFNSKTVRSLNLETRIIDHYSKSLENALYLAIRNGNLVGIMFGFAQSLISTMLAIIFLIGAILIQNNISDVLSIYTAIYAIMFAGVQAGGNLAFLGKLATARSAACNYFQYIQIENQSNNSRALNSQFSNRHFIALDDVSLRRNNKAIEGKISFDNISFKYPSRQTPLFQKFNLTIKPGEKVALVGQSGSGKSSIANMLFRLYDPSAGNLFIDNFDIRTYSHEILHKELGIVSQEPVLFNRSVYQNIKYNMQEATFQDVVQASKQANAFNFICQGNFGMKGDNGQSSAQQLSYIDIEAFKKSVGTKGSYLSGGQKQRIAIARTLIRKPAIMVLDEATSALDNANEKLVQQAIQKIKGITQIVIAHRLSTVQNCDRIVVLRKGKIEQQGKYQQLIKLRGYFYSLVNSVKQQ